MQRACESQPAQLTVTQAAGMEVNAAAAAAVQAGQSEPHLLPRYLNTCSMTTTDGWHDETGGQVLTGRSDAVVPVMHTLC
jgi:hypothetical protein